MGGNCDKATLRTAAERESASQRLDNSKEGVDPEAAAGDVLGGARILGQRLLMVGEAAGRLNAEFVNVETEIVKCETYCNALRNGLPTPYSPEVVMRLNSLQVGF